MEAAGSRWVGTAAAAAVALALAGFSARRRWRRRCRALAERVRELEAQLKASVEKGAAERCGRIRAQQALRKALARGQETSPSSSSSSSSSGSYPMTPMATVRSCFSTRNGTPRQPLLVPLARACLTLDTSRVPPGALEGLAEYSHCWILYVFHLNTDLEKLWKHPSRSGFKAKVRVPRLKGGKMGVLATRSPHRPCPIGLTVAKVEGVDGRAVLLSGVDLVDGTPVLDIKPYLPYSDCVRGARTPTWLQESSSLDVASVQFSEGFSSLLAKCWEAAGKWSLYASDDELKDLIRQVLSWDIRSMSQRNRPHDATSADKSGASDVQSDMGNESDEGSRESARASSLLPDEVTYHLIVEGVDITYRIDENSNIMVEGASLSNIKNNSRHSGSNATWRNKFS
ncbi:unnamed protein product [Spirodela intermedia]|uniref:TsaA-like domain-containing protein n=1 Tax=Spirodela intermedia TaxID=51605 RepID=A0A7I8LC08_SPIIN|nr:unnamed protein product [Spirodela intermedia]